MPYDNAPHGDRGEQYDTSDKKPWYKTRTTWIILIAILLVAAAITFAEMRGGLILPRTESEYSTTQAEPDAIPGEQPIPAEFTAQSPSTTEAKTKSPSTTKAETTNLPSTTKVKTTKSPSTTKSGAKTTKTPSTTGTKPKTTKSATTAAPQPETRGRPKVKKSLSKKTSLAVHFVDVGQGDCIYIRTPDGSSMLIDAGENGNGGTVMNYLDTYGSRTLDYVVATHPHSDHIGSLDEVIRACTVRSVLMPRLEERNTPATLDYRNLLTAIRKSKAKTIAAKPGRTFSLGSDGVCTVLSPAVQDENLNNMSVVLRLDWGDVSFLFTGDAERAAEKSMTDNYPGYLNVDVLKLGHHGSSTSSSAAFLRATDPAYAVISCGAGNDYGHPHLETLQKLEKLDTKVLRTDELGSIRFYTDGTYIRTESDHE